MMNFLHTGHGDGERPPELGARDGLDAARAVELGAAAVVETRFAVAGKPPSGPTTVAKSQAKASWAAVWRRRSSAVLPVLAGAMSGADMRARADHKPCKRLVEEGQAEVNVGG
jgi:hypothetical protein